MIFLNLVAITCAAFSLHATIAVEVPVSERAIPEAYVLAFSLVGSGPTAKDAIADLDSVVKAKRELLPAEFEVAGPLQLTRGASLHNAVRKFAIREPLKLLKAVEVKDQLEADLDRPVAMVPNFEDEISDAERVAAYREALQAARKRADQIASIMGTSILGIRSIRSSAHGYLEVVFSLDLNNI